MKGVANIAVEKSGAVEWFLLWSTLASQGSDVHSKFT